MSYSNQSFISRFLIGQGDNPDPLNFSMELTNEWRNFDAWEMNKTLRFSELLSVEHL